MSAATSTRPPFHAVDTTSAGAVLAPAAPDDVESPSLSSSNALARFEFEPGRSKEGTKVLMVEWEDDDTTRSIAGDWEISWEGKRTVLPAREHADATTKDTNATDVPVNRLYFLLGAGVAVPTTVATAEGKHHLADEPSAGHFQPGIGSHCTCGGQERRAAHNLGQEALASAAEGDRRRGEGQHGGRGFRDGCRGERMDRSQLRRALETLRNRHASPAGERYTEQSN